MTEHKVRVPSKISPGVCDHVNRGTVGHIQGCLAHHEHSCLTACFRDRAESKVVFERECCLLVLNLVSSTLSCIRQPRPRFLVLDVCGFV
jgi:hypothetical protein